MQKKLIGLSLALWALASGLSGPSAFAGTDERLDELDQKVKVLERKLELADEAAAEKAKTSAAGEAGKDGFLIKSQDGQFVFKLRGLVQEDGRFYVDDQRVPGTNTFLLRRVRPIVDATFFKDFDGYFVPDFGGGTAVIQDAFIEYHPVAALRFRFGKFKSPVGLERLQSDTVTRFIEPAFPTALVPNRDVGIQVSGDPFGGALSYAVGIFDGASDAGSLDTDTNDNKEVAARIFALPFKNSYSDWVRDLGFGVGGSYGTFAGTLPSYKTTGQNTFFTYSSGVTADGIRSRLAPQLYYYFRRLGFLTEYTFSTQEVRRGTLLDQVDQRAWQVSASVLLTDDNASFKGVSPKKPFDPKQGQWGALEIAARYHEFHADSDAFTASNAFASKAVSASIAQAWTVGFNWYLNKIFKVAGDYEETSFLNGATANSDRETEKVFLTRFQLAF